MSPDDLQTLARLLRQLASEGLGTPNMPREVFPALRGVVAQPTVEVLATTTGRDVLLTRRDDRNFQGFHLPGGFVGCGETLETACERVARAELGVCATLERVVGHYTWADHPYASPLSLLCLCRLDGEPSDGTYFAELPPDVLAEHRVLLERFWMPAI